VAAELRLRNTAGMIVIDFLRLASDDDNNQVDAALRRHLGRDRARCKCLGFTAMGLYELVRTAR
jgi:ribonuclease G